jgi:hypothetical protein
LTDKEENYRRGILEKDTGNKKWKRKYGSFTQIAMKAVKAQSPSAALQMES